MHSENEQVRPDDPQGWQEVNRVVYPIQDQDLIMPLYAIEWTRPVLSDAVIDGRTDKRLLHFGHMNKSTFEGLINESVRKHPGSSVDLFTVDSRTSITLKPGRHISACTYFNAFPAAYWKRWTLVSEVRFTARTEGRGFVTLFRSTGRGLNKPVTRIRVGSADGVDAVDVTIPMTGLLDGGYFWFDAEADADRPLTVSDAAWSVREDERKATGKTTLSIAITTFNRAGYCLDQLKTICADPTLRARLDTVYCVDQGTDLVRDQPGFAQVAREMGDQLTYLRQPNIGGSGGFSRGMYETLKAARSAYTLLLDDDAISEPEAILRAVQFADYTVRPTIVGGGMFHLDNRTVLYTEGERMDPNTAWMRSSQGLDYNHDFALNPLRDSPGLHRRIDTDFNGWWMCLIPTAVMRSIGLAMPFFIKFDDTEFSLRASEHGFPTVCLPGVAVWHQAWHDKDPARTWEEYFFQRNRWISALIHYPKPRPGYLFQMLYGDMNVGLKFFYSAMCLRHMGLRDIMKGPRYIVESMPDKLAQVRKAREGFEDAATATRADAFPEPAREFDTSMRPTSGPANNLEGVKAVGSFLLPGRDGTRDARPEVAIPADRTVWSSFSGISSALVTTPDGNGLTWCRRDRRRFRQGMEEGLRLASTLLKHWETLSHQYRSYDMASMDSWRAIFTRLGVEDGNTEE